MGADALKDVGSLMQGRGMPRPYVDVSHHRRGLLRLLDTKAFQPFQYLLIIWICWIV